MTTATLTRGGLARATGANYVTLGLWTRQRRLPHSIDTNGRALYPPEAIDAVLRLLAERGGRRTA